MINLFPESFINIKQTGFSCRGAYTTIFIDDNATSDYGQCVLWLGDIRGEANLVGRIKLAKITPVWLNHDIPYTLEVSPSVLTINSNYGWIKITFQDPHMLRIQGQGIGVRLSMALTGHECGRERNNHSWEVSFRRILNWMFIPIEGHMDVSAPYDWHSAGGGSFTVRIEPEFTQFELAIMDYQHNALAPDSFPDFDVCCENVQKDFEDYLKKLPASKPEYDLARKQAAWIIWSCNLSPHGFMKRRDQVVMLFTVFIIEQGLL